MTTEKTGIIASSFRGQATEGSVQLVTFRLAGELYGIPINQVREIILPGTITRIPKSPSYLRGVIHLRKRIIPVLDLGVVFGGALVDLSEKTRILIVQVQGVLIGALVDSVAEVLRLSQDTIQPPPSLAGPHCRFITGVAEINGQLLMVVDMHEILSAGKVWAYKGNDETAA